MRFTSAIVASVLGFALTGVLAAPLPQVAGEGSACGSVLTQTDNGVGYGTENAEDNTANTVSSVKGSSRRFRFRIRRQIAGEGDACDSVLTQTDNGVGYGTENAEDNTAQTISTGKVTTGSTSSGGSSGGSAPPPPPPPPNRRRQLDKVAKGAQTLSDAAGTGAETSAGTTEAEDLDGTSTGDAANAGAEVGNTEASTLENAGSQVPKSRRQLDKVAKGAQTLSDAAGTGAETSAATTEAEDLDGTSTGDAANAGAEIGSTEASTLEEVGSDVP